MQPQWWKLKGTSQSMLPHFHDHKLAARASVHRQRLVEGIDYLIRKEKGKKKKGNLPGDLEAATFPEEQGSLPHDAFVSAEVHIFIRIHRRYGAAGNSCGFFLSSLPSSFPTMKKCVVAAGKQQQKQERRQRVFRGREGIEEGGESFAEQPK